MESSRTLIYSHTPSPQGDAEAASHAGTAAPSAAAALPPPAPSEDEASATSKGADTLQFAARQLGVHYLKRYFLLICYR